MTALTSVPVTIYEEAVRDAATQRERAEVAEDALRALANGMTTWKVNGDGSWFATFDRPPTRYFGAPTPAKPVTTFARLFPWRTR